MLQFFRLIKFYLLLHWKIQQFTSSDTSVTKKYYELVSEHPDKIVLYTEEGRWTYLEV